MSDEFTGPTTRCPGCNRELAVHVTTCPYCFAENKSDVYRAIEADVVKRRKGAPKNSTLTEEDRRRIYEEEKARFEAQDRIKAEKGKEANKLIGGCCGLMVLIPVLFGIWASINGSDKASNLNGDWSGAWVAAKGFVSQSLKAPATADFPWPDRNYVQDLGGGKYRVRAYVDAENSFGAKIRSNWMVVEQYAGNEQYRLVDIAINERK